MMVLINYLFLLKFLYVSVYSFIQHPVEKLHEIIPTLLPGIEKIITIHYDSTQKLIKGNITSKEKREYTTHPLNIDKSLPVLQRYMEEKNPYDWYNKQSLPFEIDNRDKSPTLDIFSEFHNIVLLIRIPDEQNEFCDLVFLYLNENPGNFGVTNSINPLTTDNKSIIAFILNNTIKSFISLHNQDRDTLKSHNSRTRQIIDHTESLKNEIQLTKENYGVSLVKLCQKFTAEYAAISNKIYSFSPGAIDKIKNYKGDLKDLETMIKDTLIYADSLFLDEKPEIEVLEWHLQFDQPVSKTTKNLQQRVIESKDDKYARTLQLLDKLENAALVVKSSELKLTGTNVGKACQQPVSAPAISDALYNHKGKINSLLKKYPEKWVTLRNDFRPMKNIMEEQVKANHLKTTPKRKIIYVFNMSFLILSVN